MKWFAGEVYKVCGSVLLTAGWPIPPKGLFEVKGEGVVLIPGAPHSYVVS